MVIAREFPQITGSMVLTVFNEDGSVDTETHVNNVMCDTGYAVLATAILWSATIDQNGNLGLSLTPSYCAPMYGAVGTGSSTVSNLDKQLQSELGRGTVYSGTTNGSSVTFNFFFGLTLVNWTIAEAGIFLQATGDPNSGALLDHALINPAVSKTTVQTATLAVTLAFS